MKIARAKGGIDEAFDGGGRVRQQVAFPGEGNVDEKARLLRLGDFLNELDRSACLRGSSCDRLFHGDPAPGLRKHVVAECRAVARVEGFQKHNGGANGLIRLGPHGPLKRIALLKTGFDAFFLSDLNAGGIADAANAFELAGQFEPVDKSVEGRP